MAVSIVGLGATAVLLLPIIAVGFPTTISWSNWDAWGYAGMVDWLLAHPARGAVGDIGNPLSFIAAGNLANGFPPGAESAVAALAFITRRVGYETIGPAFALGALVSTSAWATLGRAVGVRNRPWTLALVAGIAALSPMIVLTSVQVYGNQFLSICLWPVVVALFIQAVRVPRIGTIAPAGLALAASVAIYPTMLIWIGPTLIVSAGGVVLLGPNAGRRKRTRRAARALVLGIGVALIVGPIQWIDAAQNLLFLSGKPGNRGFPAQSGTQLSEIGLGSAVSDGPVPPGWTPIVVGGVLAVVFGVLGLLAARQKSRRMRQASWVALGAAIPTIIIATAYMSVSPYPYGAYKAVLNGGALTLGVLIVGSIVAIGAKPALVTAAIAAITIAWVPQTTALLDVERHDEGTGFRAADVRLGRFLGTLGPSSEILVEGTTKSPIAFRVRMSVGYMAKVIADRPVEGLGTTATYLTGGGGDEWIPKVPWSEVIAYTASPVITERRRLWVDPPYDVFAAPVVDITTWGAGWQPAEVDGTTPFAWVTEPASVLISNRAARQQQAVLSGKILSAGFPRVVTLRTAGRPDTQIAADTHERTPFRLTMRLPPRSVTQVHIIPRPGRPVDASSTDARQVAIQLYGLRVTPVVPLPR